MWKTVTAKLCDDLHAIFKGSSPQDYIGERKVKWIWVLHFFIHIAGEMPETLTKKWIVSRIQPPCERFGCGKRAIYALKKAFPKSFFSSKIRQLQLKRSQKRVGPPSCGRYGCGKRKWRLPNDSKFISRLLIRFVCVWFIQHLVFIQARSNSIWLKKCNYARRFK